MLAPILSLLLVSTPAASAGAASPQSAPAVVLLPAQPPSTPPVDQPPLAVPPRPAGELGYLTAGELADRCADTSAASSSYCFAYVAAVHDSARAYEIWLREKEFCIPTRTPQADLRRAFLTYVTAYPSHRSGQAASVVLVALKESFPCPIVSGVPSAPRGAAGTVPPKSQIPRQ